METLQIKIKILTELDITDPFIQKSYLTIQDTMEFLEVALFKSELEEFNSKDIEAVKHYLQDNTLEELAEDISTIKHWQVYEIPLTSKPKTKEEELTTIGGYLLYGDNEFIMENFFYSTYDYDNLIDILSEQKTAEYILFYYKSKIIYEGDTLLRLYLFSC